MRDVAMLHQFCRRLEKVCFSSPRANGILAYTSCSMGENTEQTQVWIAIVGVQPCEGRKLLSVNEGAYVNFAPKSRAPWDTIASNCWNLKMCAPFSRSDGSSEEIV